MSTETIGFTNHVTINPKTGEVIKIPRTLRFKDPKREGESAELHGRFLGISLIPDTDVHVGENGYEVHQEYVGGFTPIDLERDFVQDDVQRILEAGAAYQKETGNLFDIFGLQGMIALFHHYFPEGSMLRKASDLSLNASYLEKVHNFPVADLGAIKAKKVTSPFIAHNIGRDAEGKLKFIDLDYRPLTPTNPLNLVGNWITQKALADLQFKNSGKLIQPKPKIMRI